VACQLPQVAPRCWRQLGLCCCARQVRVHLQHCHSIGSGEAAASVQECRNRSACQQQVLACCAACGEAACMQHTLPVPACSSLCLPYTPIPDLESTRGLAEKNLAATAAACAAVGAPVTRPAAARRLPPGTAPGSAPAPACLPGGSRGCCLQERHNTAREAEYGGWLVLVDYL
jgi:hypothetical protein